MLTNRKRRGPLSRRGSERNNFPGGLSSGDPRPPIISKTFQSVPFDGKGSNYNLHGREFLRRLPLPIYLNDIVNFVKN